MDDYYEILGVAPTADFEAIRQAYRRLALANHPDRGGSHDAMVRINEAWNVLSNPATRAEYDQFRVTGQNTDDFHTPAAEKARAEAKDYPADWDEFDAWWNGMAADFHKTKFELGAGFWPGGLMATAETASGACFIAGGVLVVWAFMPDGFLWPLSGQYMFLKIAFVLTVGSWLGALAHKITRALFFDAPVKASPAAGATVSFSTASHRATQPNATATPPTMQVACPACGQDLRVPVLHKPIRVTCKSCNLVFRKEPRDSATPIP